MEGNPIGLAVSGGGDSLALAALAANWSQTSGRQLAAVTINHQLRPEAEAEALAAGDFCREFGISHTILNWEDWDGAGNLQAAARKARLQLINDWAFRNDIGSVATGHTFDDQAETVLLRLLRGSGVDGLAGMSPSKKRGQLTWHRPLLGVRRDALRDYLTHEGLPWIDDPSNDDPRFDRIKARTALAALAQLGITPEGLVDTASRMARARRALESQTRDLVDKACRVDRGDVLVAWETVANAEEEIRLRLVSHILKWVSGAAYSPRATALAQAIAALRTGKTHVLMGVIMTTEGPERRFGREFAAVEHERSNVGEIWDGRWKVDGKSTGAEYIGALGETGIRDCPNWRETGLPQTSLIASPAVWAENRLIAAPLAGFSNGWSAILTTQSASLTDAIITH